MSVYLSCPTKRNISAATSVWLVQEMLRLPGSVYRPVIDVRPLDHARNRMVHEFLSSDCTHLFTFDSDCVPVVGTVERLRAYDLPFISAPHECTINGERGIMAVDWSDEHGGYRQHHPMQGLQRCDAVGGSGLMIRRDVFEAIQPPWFAMTLGADGLLAKGEDFYFCEKLRANGYDIWADFGLTQRHI